MGLNRYYVPELVGKTSIALVDDEAHHAIHVRREAVGNPCLLFDGKGNEANAQFQEMSRRTAVLQVGETRFLPRDLPGQVVLAVAMPKGDRQRAVIEKGVELGVHRLVPLMSHRSVSVSRDEKAPPKWERYVIEACKQCERNRLLVIDPPVSFPEWIAGNGLSKSERREAPEETIRWVAHPAEDALSDAQWLARRAKQRHGHLPLNPSPPSEIHGDTRTPGLSSRQRCLIAIGPEGGFTQEEIALAIEHGWELIHFGERVLRVETAVAVAATVARWILD